MYKAANRQKTAPSPVDRGEVTVANHKKGEGTPRPSPPEGDVLPHLPEPGGRRKPKAISMPERSTAEKLQETVNPLDWTPSEPETTQGKHEGGADHIRGERDATPLTAKKKKRRVAPKPPKDVWTYTQMYT